LRGNSWVVRSRPSDGQLEGTQYELYGRRKLERRDRFAGRLAHVHGRISAVEQAPRGRANRRDDLAA
jgi:hypothetical protein